MIDRQQQQLATHNSPNLFRILHITRYNLLNIRSKHCYIIFQLAQLFLATSIIIVGLTSSSHFKGSNVMIMQYFLLIMMVIDMLIKLIIEGFQGILKNKGNIIDLIILLLFGLTLIGLSILYQKDKQGNSQGEYQKILQADDIFIIFIVMLRYIIQIYRTVVSIKNTHNNIQINKEIKKINLNVQPVNATGLDVGIQDDQRIKQKIMKIKQTKTNKQTNKIEQSQ